mgnify:CR=1 FL=1
MPARLLIPEQVTDLCQRYQAGERVVDLATNFHISVRNVERWLHVNKITRRRPANHRMSGMQIEEMCHLYLTGESGASLGRAFGISTPAVFGFLERRHIELRHDLGGPRRYTCDHRFFQTIDTESKAYWLGFLAADGTVTNRDVHLQLAACDTEHVSRFRDALQATHPIRPVNNHGYPATIMTISSQEMIHDLANHNVVPRKTHILRLPTLSPEMLRHYLRGYIDGDGTFTRSRIRRKDRPGLQYQVHSRFSLPGNVTFLVQVQQMLMRFCGVSATKIFLQRAHFSQNIGILAYGGTRQVRTIFDWLYHDATVWLPRKRERFEAPVQDAKPRDIQANFPFDFFPQHRRRRPN